MSEPVKLPVTPIKNPLTQEDLESLNKLLEDIKGHKDLIQRVQASGIPVDEHLERINLQENVARLLKQNFFPVTLSPPMEQ